LEIKIKRGFIINAGAIFTTVTLIIMLDAWGEFMQYMRTLPNGLGEIGMVLGFIVILTSIRFPAVIGDFYDEKISK